jgi:hypothetical protein
VDVVARLANARTTEERLKEIIRTRTGKVSDILEAERELARVRESIERMEAHRRSLEDRVRLATIDLTLAEELRAAASAAESITTRLRNAAVAGWVNLRESAVGLVDFILRYSLALVIWAALVALPLRWAVRRFRRPEGVEGFSDTPSHS